MEKSTEKLKKRLKESFKGKLKEELVSIIRLIENKTEIEESYLIRAAEATEGLLEIAKMEEDSEKRIIFQGLLRIIKSKKLERKETELRTVLELLG